mmetsp:Transcript_43104/g.48925  ORF Transcript_43104/g.48925 Transcript_43104/m.48925 type:complete len:256 (-) Transcript_43104:122-889(-)|eukprot:CAMPEP_0194172106 /NCGR_PEP_ID=MMETSP0154-20130528/6595_1 /TAXON_ID=1049557 /ORGANISM="Thalassiothrix antarctica, Strain L6-D1" /LENGTH=255 /DNA_ID=CAMNT_0038884641 /DNA_START=77 /DNA_END=844 /DNA_ORIENTATION=-
MSSEQLERVIPMYCGACGMPPEYCEYSPDYETHCTPWLQKNHPNLLQQHQRNGNEDDVVRPENPWTTEERLVAFYEKYDPSKVDKAASLLEKYVGKEENLFTALGKKYGEEPNDPYYDNYNSDDDEDEDDDEVVPNNNDDKKSSKKKRRGAGAKKAAKVDTRIVIQKITRNRKKATTVVIGMDTVPGIKLKDVSKVFSKRFAGSSSVKDNAKGDKEIIVQGDHMDAIAEMIVTKFGVAGESVYLDIEGEFVPFKK